MFKRTMFSRFSCAAAVTFAAAVALTIAPASAHHVADGKTPTGWAEGLLSGLAHPVIGLDHLVFIVIIGLVAACLKNGLRTALAFGAALLVGVLVYLIRPNLPMVEVLVAGSTMAAGMVLILRQQTSARLWTLFAVAAGLIHGYALGEPIAAAPGSVIAMYLMGLAASAALIIVPVKAIAEMTVIEDRAEALKLQAAGGAFTALGMFFVASAIAST